MLYMKLNAMDRVRDPIEKSADDSIDLYDVTSWEVRTRTDWIASVLWRGLSAVARLTVVLVAFSLLLGVGGLAVLTDPATGLLTLFSALPAIGLTAYVYFSDVTSSEPLSLLTITFLLGVLTANFAAVLNTLFRPLFRVLGFVGLILFFSW